MRIKRVYYSEPLLEEKEFGIQEMALRAKRRGQVAIGKTRTGIADRLSKSAYNDYNKYKVANDKAIHVSIEGDNKNKLINNKSVAKELFRDIRKGGGRVFIGDRPGFVGLNKDNLELTKQGIQSGLKDTSINNTDKSYLKKLDNHLKSGNQFILASPENSIGTLAHESGHQKRFNSKNPVTKFVADKNIESRGRMHHGKYGFKVDNEKGIVTADSKRYNPLKAMYDHAMIVTEERGATKKGLNRLKELGVNQEVLKGQKQELKVAGDTYKYSGRSRVKSLLADKIQIPSRRQATLKQQEMNRKSELQAKRTDLAMKSFKKRSITTPEVKKISTVSSLSKPISTKPITPTPIQKPTVLRNK